jgi:DNA-binding transcriptional MerR regulator
MPIGRFATSVRLSVKALRHYDELGLLVPALVDAATGYRYYAPEQARDALLIAMLRELDLPLATIRRALAATPEVLQRLLAGEAERMERELLRHERALRGVQHLARSGTLLPYRVDAATAAPLRVARRALDTDVDRLVPETGEVIYEMLEALRARGWKDDGPVLSESEDAEPDGRQRVHVCVGVARDYALPGAETAELSGGSFLRLLHVGPYEALGLAYHALHAHAQERGHERRGPIREVYVNDPAHVAPDAVETEVWLPIREASLDEPQPRR